MEHVGRHLEKMATNANMPSMTGAVMTASPLANGVAPVNEVIEQESDEFMIVWAERERIIERRGNGTWRLCDGSGAGADEGEGDAEGEEERLSRPVM